MLYLANSWAGQWTERHLDRLADEFGGVRGNWLTGHRQSSYEAQPVSRLLYAPMPGVTGAWQPSVGQVRSQPTVAWILYPDVLLGWDADTFSYGTRVEPAAAPLLESASLIVANSGFTAGLVQKAGLGDVRVFPLGIDWSAIRDLGRPRSEPERLTVVWNHQWRWHKNVGGAFEIVLRLAGDHPDADFVLGRREQWGGSPFKRDQLKAAYAEFRSTVRAEQLTNVALVDEFGSQQGYWAFLRRADIAFSCSHEESFGIGMLESAAAGAACVAPRAYAYPEVLPSALLVDPGVEPAVAAISSLLQDEELLRRVGERCRHDASRYDLWSTCEQLVDLFRSV